MSDKVAVAMSGGVDSSVAATLCVEKYGKENVFGVTMRLFCYGDAEADEKSCCSLDAVNDAKAVCDQLGIPHYAINLEKEFEAEVISNFVSEYQKGHTPNPCIRCNQVIKFKYLLEKVKELGADLLATGHYARILREGPKTKCQMPNTDQIFKYQLLKGVDEKKDQSYFLYNLTQEQLGHIIFPLGELEKTKTREIAKKYGLKTAQKTESQEICFVTSGSTADYLRPRVNFEPGNIMNEDGKVVGTHEGLSFYTVGQRKGLGGGFSEPFYVTRIDVQNNQLFVGPERELFSSEFEILKPHWIIGVAPKNSYKCQVMIRYNMKPVECEIVDDKVRFTEPQKAIAPGQSAVFYDGDVCLGGALIK
jgi:tRNA-specific 2-thiouridylase